MSCINIPLRHEEEIMTAHIFSFQHMMADELERGLKEKEKELIRLLEEEDHLRSGKEELLNRLTQKKLLTTVEIDKRKQELGLDNQVGEMVRCVFSIVHSRRGTEMGRIKRERIIWRSMLKGKGRRIRNVLL